RRRPRRRRGRRGGDREGPRGYPRQAPRRRQAGLRAAGRGRGQASVGELSDEQRAFEESARGFLSRTIPPERVAEFEREGEVPADVWEAFARQGLLGVGVDPELGGSGGGAVELSLLVRELARTSLLVAMRYLASAYSGVQT